MIVNNIQSIGKITSVKDFFQTLTGQLFQVEIISKGDNNEGLISLGGNKFQALLEPQFQAGEKFQAFVKEVTEQGIILSRIHPENTPTSLMERPSMSQITRVLITGFGLSQEDAAFVAKYIAGNDQNEGTGSLFMQGKGLNPDTKTPESELYLLPGKNTWTLQKGVPDSTREMDSIVKQFSILSSQNKDVEAEQILRLTVGQLNTLLNRGISLNQEIAALMTKYINEPNASKLKTLLTNTTAEINPLAALLRNIVPDWSKLNGKQFEAILIYLKRLGLEYESQIPYQLKTMDCDDVPDTVDNSVKSLLLKMVTADSLQRDNQKAVTNLLEEITGQQLWIQSGNNDTAYFLLHLPLQDNGNVYECRVAVESSRKGLKADVTHCHLALQVETENLNLIGADLNLYDNELSLCLLSDGQNDLESLVAGLSDQIKQNFADIGINLEKISFKSYDESAQFSKFISGQNILGVDIRG